MLANVDTQAELLSAAAAAAASHTHAASDIASGSLATARLADGTATAGYVPISDGDGTSTWGAVAASSHTHAISDTTGLQTALDGKLGDTGDTISGDLLHSASIRIGPNTSDGADNLTLTVGNSGNTRGGRIALIGNEAASMAGSVNIGLGNAANSLFRVLAGDGSTPLLYCTNSTGITTVGGNGFELGWVNLRFTGSPAAPSGTIRGIHANGGTTDLYANVPTGGVLGVSVNGTAQSTMGTGGLQFPTAHSIPATSVYGVWRGATGIALQSASDGRSALFANSFNIPTFSVYGPSHSTTPGQISGVASGVSLAAGATRVVGSTGQSGTVLVVNVTDHKRATFSVENGTPTKIEGDATIVAGAPGASQIGLELSSTTLRVNNGYAGAKLITTIALLAQ